MTRVRNMLRHELQPPLKWDSSEVSLSVRMECCAFDWPYIRLSEVLLNLPILSSFSLQLYNWEGLWLVRTL